jgi:hypothetical protein
MLDDCQQLQEQYGVGGHHFICSDPLPNLVYPTDQIRIRTHSSGLWFIIHLPKRYADYGVITTTYLADRTDSFPLSENELTQVEFGSSLIEGLHRNESY